MAGHSKWSNIKRQKAREDSKRAKIFTKHVRAITVAAREGGADVEFNPALQMEIDRARAVNMPNDNIDRAIKAAFAAETDSDYQEVMYEGYGPSGVAVMVSTLTNNRNRTAPDLRHAFDKFGGNLGTSGSVSFGFDHKGTIIIESQNVEDEDTLMMEAIEAGAEDFEAHDDFYEITTSVKDFISVRNSLEENYKLSMAELGYLPQNYVELTAEDDIKNMEELIDVLEDHDDVQDIYHNWDIDE